VCRVCDLNYLEGAVRQSVRDIYTKGTWTDRIPSEAKEALRVGIILALAVILIYGDVVFLGYTLSPAVYNYAVLIPPPTGYHGRWLVSSPVMDPLASGGVIWPTNLLISRIIFSGEFPLWNPYQGTGAPLTADTTWSAYFPTNLLYMISNQYWDFVWLLELWSAGVLCYLFLRKLNLRWLPATGGALAYALSGAFILYPFVPWTNVAIMTPALLLAAKRCFEQPFNGYSIALGSIIFSFSLLGAHIEALVIQCDFPLLFH